MITINDSIFEKASKILEEERKKKKEERLAIKRKNKYIKTCIKAKICPICGEPLLEREPTKEEKRESHYDVISYVLYCEKSDFVHIEGWFADYDEC